MTIHSSILAWRIPWTEEPGGLWSIGFQRVEHDLSSSEVKAAGRAGFDPRVGKIPWMKEMATRFSSILAWKIPWTEEPGGLYTPRGSKELDTTERFHFLKQLSTHA